MTYEEVKEQKDIVTNTYMSRADFRKLVPKLKEDKANKLFKDIKEKILADLETKKARLPDAKHIPTVLALKHLEVYGISRKSILANYEFEEKRLKQ